jgi:hypothetical protein
VEMLSDSCGVTILGRSGIRYREGTRTLFVDGEIQTGPSDFIIYASSLQRWDDDHQAVTADDRTRIVANIRDVFQRHGLSLAVG